MKKLTNECHNETTSQDNYILLEEKEILKPSDIIDCRSDEGVTIGLIDAIISISRILVHRDLSSAVTKEALKDLIADEDLKYILNFIKNY